MCVRFHGSYSRSKICCQSGSGRSGMLLHASRAFPADQTCARVRREAVVHTAASDTDAIWLYESIGFTLRRRTDCLLARSRGGWTEQMA